MFLSITLAVLLTATPADLRLPVEAFVDGLRRDDRPAVRGTRPQRNSLGTSYDRLHLLDEITIDSYRLAAVEPAEKSVFAIVEMEGWATVTHTGERVPWPRWWSLEYEPQEDGKLLLVTAMMLERRLGERHALSSPEELDRLLAAYPRMDVEMFMVNLSNHATDHDSEGCPTLLWMLRKSLIGNDVPVTKLVYEMMSYLAQTDPVQHDMSVFWAEQSLPLAPIDGKPDAFCDSYYALGEAYRLAGRADEAIAAFRKAATYHEAMFDPRLANRSLFTASELEIERNNLRQALTDAEQSQKMLRPYSSQHDRMIAAHRLATIHERLGNIEISRRYYEQAREQARGKKDPDWQGSIAHDLAGLAAVSGDTAEARRLLEEADYFTRFIPDLNLATTIRIALASRQRDDGDLAAAEETFAAALARINKPLDDSVVATLHVERSLLRLAQGRVEEALADARLARQKDPDSGPRALTAEGRALRALSRWDDAESALRAAIDIVELELSQRPLDETGSAAVFVEKLIPYRELLDLLVEEGCAREALTVAEQMRARSLRDSLRNGRVDLSAGLDEAKRTQERDLEQAIALVNKKILAASGTATLTPLQQERDEARLALRRFRSELYAMHPELDRRRPGNEKWQAVAAPGEVVLELAVTAGAAFLFVVHGEDVDVHRIPVSRDDLGKRIDAFVAALEQRDFAYRKPARALYELLLSPAATQLASAKTVRIVPDGALWRLPFHALIDEGGKHLIERLPIAYSPSLALTRMPARSSTGRQRTLLAFADPAIGSETVSVTRSLYRDVTLGRLPDAATEARAIARIYGDATVRVGAEARETAFKDAAPAFRVLHLATHSIVDDGAPMFSSIVLAASEANPLEDGLLEAREIAELKLGADLAVLSACETAGGAVTAGEGVIGLSWAFLAAGVPTTVVSQWKVGSASTADLMIAFHRKLHDGADPAVALRAAMLELRRDARWAHPFYWAPFVVIENSGSPPERQ